MGFHETSRDSLQGFTKGLHKAYKGLHGALLQALIWGFATEVG